MNKNVKVASMLNRRFPRRFSLSVVAIAVLAACATAGVHLFDGHECAITDVGRVGGIGAGEWQVDTDHDCRR